VAAYTSSPAWQAVGRRGTHAIVRRGHADGSPPRAAEAVDPALFRSPASLRDTVDDQ